MREANYMTLKEKAELENQLRIKQLPKEEKKIQPNVEKKVELNENKEQENQKQDLFGGLPFHLL